MFPARPGAVWNFFGHWHFFCTPREWLAGGLQAAGEDPGVPASRAPGGSGGMLAMGSGIQLSRAVYSTCVLELLNLHFFSIFFFFK